MRIRVLQCLLIAGTLFSISCGSRMTLPAGTPSAGAPSAGTASEVAVDASFFATNGSDANSGPFAGSVKIVNQTSASARIGVSIDGYLFRDKNEMLAYIAAIPPMFDGEPDYRKAWRFVTARAYFYTPFTGSNQQHDPLLFINSLGYGYCDDFATVLAMIWQWQGYESRVWWLSGHVVPEIRANDRWMMFDGDFGVYYSDAAGAVASVDELSSNPQLIVQPIDPLYDLSYVAYEPLVSSIYGSTEDNEPKPPVTGESKGMEFDLPAGSEFVFPVDDVADKSQFGDGTLSHPLYYGAEIHVPAMARDTVLSLPLFVVGISGSGEVEIGGTTYEIGSPALDALFAQFFVLGNYAAPVTNLTLRAGASNVVISMSVSAFAVNGPTQARVHIYQDGGSGAVGFTYTAAASPVPAPVAETLSGVDLKLDQAPYQYISPQFVFSDLNQLLTH